jgi:hypothetical protein
MLSPIKGKTELMKPKIDPVKGRKEGRSEKGRTNCQYQE